MPVRPSPAKIKEKNIPLAGERLMPETTAAKRAKMPDFIAACKEQGVEPTKRQAAKFNGRRGRWSK